MSLSRDEYRELARQIADEAIGCLYVNEAGMFRSHPGEDRCDAVDGPGILLLALLYLDTGKSSTGSSPGPSRRRSKHRMSADSACAFPGRRLIETSRCWRPDARSPGGTT